MVAGASVVVVLNALVTASAGGLAVLPDSLGAWSTNQAAGAPSVITCDNFDGPDALLAGRAVTSAAMCGTASWTAHLGAWSVVGGAATGDATLGATATLAAGAADVVVAATVGGVDDGEQAGVVLAHDGAATYLAGVLVGADPDRVELHLVQAGVAAVLASAPTVLAPSPRVEITRSAATVTVMVDGVTLVAHTLSAGELAALGAGTGAGLYSSGAVVSIDDLGITTPPVP